MARVIALLSASALALSACAAVPDLGAKPDLKTSASLASAQSLAAPAADWPADRWWTIYGDAQLDALVDEALAGSPPLAQAEARLRAAQARAQQSRAALLPSATLNGQAAETKQSYNNGIPPAFVPEGYNDTGRATLDLSWDLDLWGRNRAALAAATSEAEAARMDAAQARLMLTTGVVAAYADLGRAFAEAETARQAHENREATRKLVAQKVANGAANEGELRQAEAGLATAEHDLAAANEAIDLGRDQLAALLGAGPDRGLAIVRPARAAPTTFGLPANLAADLLGRRPDLQAARLRAEAAGKRIDVARAAFYPNVNLAAFIGVQSLGLDMLTESGSDVGQAGLALSLPIFQGGRLSGAYRGARADYDAAVAAYNETLIQALREVSDAAASERGLTTRLSAARDAQAKGEEAYRIAKLRYEGGLDNYTVVLGAENALIQQRRTTANLESRALTLDAALARALGGGFRL
ncbi:efflux transporter outer membrane subunit [Caulobacter mirabilis]|uniref:Multidrug transporter n=1 Tax=Caulobacter mirabilis TaxID=69666 RepID=A0A2D2AZ99_9CAUL|nr:efflux transporter outer membrane subunit [Caulobacter mirabilis]ATQ43315.1 multidrug transporter [Caulobacter mirabilis]